MHIQLIRFCQSRTISTMFSSKIVCTGLTGSTVSACNSQHDFFDVQVRTLDGQQHDRLSYVRALYEQLHDGQHTWCSASRCCSVPCFSAWKLFTKHAPCEEIRNNKQTHNTFALYRWLTCTFECVEHCAGYRGKPVRQTKHQLKRNEACCISLYCIHINIFDAHVNKCTSWLTPPSKYYSGCKALTSAALGASCNPSFSIAASALGAWYLISSGFITTPWWTKASVMRSACPSAPRNPIFFLKASLVLQHALFA